MRIFVAFSLIPRRRGQPLAAPAARARPRRHLRARLLGLLGLLLLGTLRAQRGLRECRKGGVGGGKETKLRIIKKETNLSDFDKNVAYVHVIRYEKRAEEKSNPELSKTLLMSAILSDFLRHSSCQLW